MKIVYVICGFNQKANEDNGMTRLAHEIAAEWQERSNEKCFVMLLEWNADFDAAADFVQGDDPDIGIIAFSWGAGHGMIDLANALAERDHCVKVACLADPVYFSRLTTIFGLRWIARAIGVIRRGKVVAPRNVVKVAWCRQEKMFPFGGQVVAEDASATTILPELLLDVGHSSVDDDPRFHALAAACAEEFAS